ncbi:MAG: 4Fe-4S binding protein [Spirochaetota bacterium]
MGGVDTAFRDLAKLLDSMPQGYPATESGVEIEILEKLFSPDEARTARFLSMKAEIPGTVAARSGLDPALVRSCLKSMAKKGLVEFEKAEGGIGYRLMPFVVGFYERQGSTIDASFAALFERYYQEGLVKAITMRPSSHRVIPIEKSIPVGVEVMPYERASSYIDAAASWGVIPCICRTQKALIGEPCHHSRDNCLILSSRKDAFERMDTIRALTRDEALQILRDASAEGLVHTTANAQAGVNYICNCCTCSCGFLRATKEFGIAEPVSRSHFLSTVDRGTCTGCASCVASCQFGALSIDAEGLCAVEAARCVGCGVCAESCPSSSLSLARKTEGELEAPPISEGDWDRIRALSRGMEAEYRSLSKAAEPGDR